MISLGSITETVTEAEAPKITQIALPCELLPAASIFARPPVPGRVSPSVAHVQTSPV